MSGLILRAGSYWNQTTDRPSAAPVLTGDSDPMIYPVNLAASDSIKWPWSVMAVTRKWPSPDPRREVSEIFFDEDEDISKTAVGEMQFNQTEAVCEFFFYYQSATPFTIRIRFEADSYAATGRSTTISCWMNVPAGTAGDTSGFYKPAFVPQELDETRDITLPASVAPAYFGCASSATAQRLGTDPTPTATATITITGVSAI